MLRQHVKSSNIKSVGYDELTQVLEIEFLTGDVYQYSKVPENTYVALMTAESIGSAVHKLLRGKFEFKRKEK